MPVDINRKIFSKRLKKISEDRNLSYQKIADMVGKSKGSISSWMHGETIPKDYLDLLPLAEYYGVSLDWLLGKETVILDGKKKVPTYNIPVKEVHDSYKKFLENNTPSGYIDDSSSVDADLYLVYNGGGMHPMILNNSKIGIEILSNDEIQYGSIHVVRTMGGSCFVCYVNYLSENTVSLDHYNKDIKSIPIKKSNIKYIDKVVSEHRRF